MLFRPLHGTLGFIRTYHRVATDLENLEKLGNLKETSESQGICLKSQGICDRIPKVREFCCLKFIFSYVEDPDFENFLGEHAPRPPKWSVEFSVIYLITGWTVSTEIYEARGPDVQTDCRQVCTKDREIYVFRIDSPNSY